jgi:hypothetical protein
VRKEMLANASTEPEAPVIGHGHGDIGAVAGSVSKFYGDSRAIDRGAVNAAAGRGRGARDTGNWLRAGQHDGCRTVPPFPIRHSTPAVRVSGKFRGREIDLAFGFPPATSTWQLGRSLDRMASLPAASESLVDRLGSRSPSQARCLTSEQADDFDKRGERVGFFVQRTRAFRQQISHLLPSASSKKTA